MIFEALGLLALAVAVGLIRRATAQDRPDYKAIKRMERDLGIGYVPSEVTDADRALVRALRAHKRRDRDALKSAYLAEAGLGYRKPPLRHQRLTNLTG